MDLSAPCPRLRMQGGLLVYPEAQGHHTHCPEWNGVGSLSVMLSQRQRRRRRVPTPSSGLAWIWVVVDFFSFPVLNGTLIG